jgi:hypothetical protein
MEKQNEIRRCKIMVARRVELRMVLACEGKRNVVMTS